MRVRLRAFARVGEILGTGEDSLAVSDGASVEAVWRSLIERFPLLAALRSSMRFARNGQVVEADMRLQEGDELALLPPSSGG